MKTFSKTKRIVHSKNFLKSASIAFIVLFLVFNSAFAETRCALLRPPLKTAQGMLRNALPVYSEHGPFLTSGLKGAVGYFGLTLTDLNYQQVSGPVDEDLPDPRRHLLNVKSCVILTDMVALGSYFNAGCAINPATGKKYSDAKQKKSMADGGAVTILENFLEKMAKDLNITIIVGGSEGKTRDGAPALKVKQVINPRDTLNPSEMSPIYVVYADPIENTNSQAENKPGSWALFFMAALDIQHEKLLRKDAGKAEKGLQDFLESKSGEELEKYGIPFSHDRYMIAVSYPGKFESAKVAEFSPADDPVDILTKIAGEHGISLDELGKRVHVVFLERERHTNIKLGLDKLREEGNEITYSTVEDGDAFAGIMAELGISTFKGKQWTIVMGASGGTEGFIFRGLAGAGVRSGDFIGRVRMAHSSRNLPGQDLSGWDAYAPEDITDFSHLGITSPASIMTERSFSNSRGDGETKFPERIFVASSITGARKNLDISSDFEIPQVTIGGDKIIVSSFAIDMYGRGFIVSSVFNSSDINYTRLSLRAENDYGFLDDENHSVKDFAIARMIDADTAGSESEAGLWKKRLGIIGLSEKEKTAIHSLLNMKYDLMARGIDIDAVIDDILRKNANVSEDGMKIIYADGRIIEIPSGILHTQKNLLATIMHSSAVDSGL